MSFSFYRADTEYCDFLRKNDPCVPYTMDDKSTRPFVGIVFSINGFSYYAPLTSPKPKHMQMKNQIDFIKIDDGKLGAINLNNMIPIHKDRLQRVDMKILTTDDKQAIEYKMLLANQLSWCNTTEKRDFICNKARKLYDIVVNKKAWNELSERCCNFPIDEKQYTVYCEIHKLSTELIHNSMPTQTKPSETKADHIKDYCKDKGVNFTPKLDEKTR